MAITTKTIIPIPVKSADIDVLQKAMSTRDKLSKCFLQTTDGKIFEIVGNVIFKRVTKI